MSERLHIRITGDNSSFLEAINGARNGVRQTQRQVEDSGMSIEDMFKRIQRAAAMSFAGFSAKEFIQKCVSIRGEFQQLEIAFSTMLGSAEKANDLMNQLVKTAATTPFDLQGVADGAKQLLAYGTSAEEVNNVLIHLGDIAAGLSIPLGELVYLYGTTMTQGRMFTQDLRQFMGRGVPIADELAKQFGVTKDKVGELVTAGKVGAEEFNKAIMSMSSEGGRFGGLMEEQSKSITGQISNIEDAIDVMFNEIGKKSEGVINDTLSGVSTIIENWEKIGKALLVVISAYGTYKAAVLAIAAAHKLAAIWGAAQAFLAEAKSITSAKDAMLLLNKATKANPIGLILGVVAAAAAAFGLFSENVDKAAQMTKKYGDTAANVIQRVTVLSATLNGLTDGSSTHKKVMEELNGILEEYGLQAIKEGDSIDDVNRKREQAIELIKQESIERQRANALEQGYNDYMQALSDAQSAMSEALQSAMSASGFWVSGNEEIQENAAAISTIIGEVVQMNISKIANKTGQEYEDGLNEIYAIIQQRMRDIGISEKTIAQTWVTDGLFNHANIVQDYINAVQQAKEGNDRYNESINKVADAEQQAAQASMTLNEKVNATEKALIGATGEVHNLYKNIKELMGKYKNNTIGFEIVFSGKAPSWMSNMGIDKLKQLAARFSALGDQAAKSKAGGMYVNGKWFSTQQLLQRGADYATAAENKQTESDNKKRKEEADAKEAEKQRKKEQTEAKKRAENAKREQEKQQKNNEQADRLQLKLRQQAEDELTSIMGEGFDKRIKEIDAGYKKELAEIDKNEREIKEKRGGTLTADDIDVLTAARSAAGKKYQKDLADAKKEEMSALYDYLKEYGSFEQQKLAITEDYEQRIKDASTEGERLRLRKEKENALSNLSFENISMGIDWSALLNGVGSLSHEMLKPMLEQLESYTKTDDYAKADIAEREKVIELIQELRQYIGTDQNTTWEELATAITRFSESVSLYKDADRNERNAVTERDEAKRKLDKGEISQEEFDKFDQAAQELGKKTVDARDEMQKLGASLNDISDDIKNYVSPLTVALNKLDAWKGVEGFSSLQSGVASFDQLKGTLDSVLPSMGDGMAKTIGTSMSSVIGSSLSSIGGSVTSILSSGIGNIIGIVAQIPRMILDLVGSVKSLVTGVLDSFTELISLRWIDDLVVSILDSVGNLINAIFDLPENLYKVLEGIIWDGVGGLLDTVVGRLGNILSFGALGSSMSGWFTNSNAKEVAETTERLTNANERLKVSIDGLRDEIGDNGGSSSIKSAKEALDAQNQYIENQREILKSQQGYHSAHHSNSYYWDLDAGRQQQVNSLLAEYAQKNGKTASRIDNTWGSFSKLSPEEMDYIRTHNAKLWGELVDIGKYDKSEYFEDFADLAGSLQEILDDLDEALTQTTFSSLKSDFISNLMDMETSAEDFADNFSEMMMQAMLNARISDLMDDQIQAFYDKWAALSKDASGNGYELTEAEVEELSKMWDSIVQQGLRIRDEVADITGYTGGESSAYEQDASTGSWQSMSEETGEELNGRFTALQVTGENISAGIVTLIATMTSLSSFADSSNTTLVEIKNLMVFNNAYLEDILEVAKKMYSDFNKKLDKITVNTK